MPAEDDNVPPIVKELAGADQARLGIAAQAYNSLWQMFVCGENGELKDRFEEWITKPQHSWLETPPVKGGLTPLAKLRRVIEAERQERLARGRDPCPDISLN